MAITILQQPVTVQPAFNNLVYKVSSDNTAQTNFKYIADIIINGQSFRMAIFPNPTYDTGTFNIATIVRNYVQRDIDKGTYGFQENVNSKNEVFVRFGEEYAGVVYPTLTTSNTTLVWNGVLDFLPAANYTKANYVMSSTPINYLTTMPSSGVVRDSEDAWLYALTETSGVVYHAKVITYDSNGSIIQTVKVNNPFQAVSSTNSKYLRFGCGTNNLNLIASSGITDGGAQPIITSSVAKYDITFQKFDGTAVSNTHTFLVDNTCTKNNVYRLHFLNRLGGYDSFSFIRASKKNITVQRSNYRQIVGADTSATAWGYSTKDRGQTTYNSRSNESISIKSDWITEATNDWLKELITSVDVYLDDATYGLVPINIVNSSYDLKQTVTDRLWNLDIQFVYSNDNYSQTR